MKVLLYASASPSKARASARATAMRARKNAVETQRVPQSAPSMPSGHRLKPLTARHLPLPLFGRGNEASRVLSGFLFEPVPRRVPEQFGTPSCDWGAKTERRMYSLGESVFEHPDGAPASPKSKSVLLSLSGYAGVEGVWGRRGGSGCDPHGVDGSIPRTARDDGIVAASLFQCPDYAIGAQLPRTRMKAPIRRDCINCEPVSFARGNQGDGTPAHHFPVRALKSGGAFGTFKMALLRWYLSLTHGYEIRHLREKIHGKRRSANAFDSVADYRNAGDRETRKSRRRENVSGIKIGKSSGSSDIRRDD